MSTPVRTMGAGSWFGIMPEVNHIPIPAGKKVFGPSSVLYPNWVSAQDFFLLQVSRKQFVSRCEQSSYCLILEALKV